MPEENNRRTIATAVAVVIILLIVGGVLVLMSPEKPKGDAIAASQPADVPTTREVRLAVKTDRLVEVADARIGTRGPRAILETIPALSYDAKDGGRDNIDHIGYWDPVTHVRYNGVDFGKGISSVSAVLACSSEFQGRILYFHLDSHDGPVFAEIHIPTTQGFEAVNGPAKDVSGVHDVFITCTDGGFNLQSIKFLRPQFATEVIPAGSYSVAKGIKEPRPGIVGHTDDGDWVKYDQIDFGTGVASVAVDLAMGPNQGKVGFHLDSPDGPLIAEFIPVPTGDWMTYAMQETPVKGATGIHDLYMTFHGGRGLPDIRTIQFKADQK